MSDTPRSSRVATGVEGLDAILGGGLPPERLYLVQGSPGAGKTTLALQFLLEGARLGERCLYISLSETAEEVRTVAFAHGWSLEAVTIVEAAMQEGEASENTLFEPSEIELGERMRGILTEVERLQPTRIVLDSCSELRLLAQSELRYRRQILALKRELAERHRTVLLIDNPAPNAPDVLLQSLAHGVIILDQLAPLFGAERRRLRVLKMRGIHYSGGYHDFVIRAGGLQVFPRLVAADHPGSHPDEPVSSGLPELDALLAGGPMRGTSTLVIGPAGTGKSALSTQYAIAAAERGEPVAMFAFDESRHTALARARGLGMPLDRHVTSGRITIQQIDPAELSPGEFAYSVRAAVEERGARVIIIDSLNGYLNAMAEEGAAVVVVQLHELLTFLGQKGVLTIIVVAQHGLISEELASPADVSYLADTVVLLRFFEMGGGVRKALSVIKKRSGPHEATIRELTLAPGGLRVGKPLAAFRGVLTGVPVVDHDVSEQRG
jgi:circadian clock protein KaiC